MKLSDMQHKVGTFPRGFASHTVFACSLVRADCLVLLNYGKALVENIVCPVLFQFYVLTPGRYVGAEEIEDDDEAFAEKMLLLTAKLETQFAESAKLEAMIRENLRGLGYVPHPTNSEGGCVLEVFSAAGKSIAVVIVP